MGQAERVEGRATSSAAQGVARPNAEALRGEYRVRLDAFEGPLDLLLYLIRRSEVDIHDIPIARLTEQYLEYLGAGSAEGDTLEGLDFETAGEFLVMAATLMEIKSRMLAPVERRDAADAGAGAAAPGEGPAGGVEDPRADLVRRLLAYKRFREAAQALEERYAAWEARVGAGPAGLPDAEQPPGAEDAPVELEDLHLSDLVEAFARIIATVDLSRVGEHHVFDDETPIQLHAADLLDRLARDAAPDGSLPLRRVLVGRTRAEAIGLFLALLELIRQKQVRFSQDRIGGEILLWRIDGEALEPTADRAPAHDAPRPPAAEDDAPPAPAR
jgi:segregation and condensation protein A